MEQNHDLPVSRDLRALKGHASYGRPVQAHVDIDGVRLRQIRVGANLSGRLLADALGVSTNTYSSYEIGRSRPSREGVLTIARILNCQPEDFLK